MSLAINTVHVTEVLLADGWHQVRGKSFRVDSYEYVEVYEHGRTNIVFGAEPDDAAGAGFEFEYDDGSFISGPISSVLAVRTAEPKDN